MQRSMWQEFQVPVSESHVKAFPSVALSNETVAPSDSLTATSSKTVRQRLSILLSYPDPTHDDKINICWFMPLHFGVIYIIPYHILPYSILFLLILYFIYLIIIYIIMYYIINRTHMVPLDCKLLGDQVPSSFSSVSSSSIFCVSDRKNYYALSGLWY